MSKQVHGGPQIALIGRGEPSRESQLFGQCLADRGAAVLEPSIWDVLGQITDGTQTLGEVAEQDALGRNVDIDSFKLRSDSPLNMTSGALDVSPSIGPYGLWAMLVLERHGIRLVNSADVLISAKDKWLNYVPLVKAGIAMPKSLLAATKEELRTGAAQLGFPVVVKVPTGVKGSGVRMAINATQIDAIVDELSIVDQPLMLQHYIECGSQDRRIVVVDGQVVDCHERIATTPGEFRANPALGSLTARKPVEADEVELALRTASVLSLRVAGMDISRVTKVLPGREYLRVGDAFLLEANGTPGFHPTDHGPENIVDYLLRLL